MENIHQPYVHLVYEHMVGVYFRSEDSYFARMLAGIFEKPSEHAQGSSVDAHGEPPEDVQAAAHGASDESVGGEPPEDAQAAAHGVSYEGVGGKPPKDAQAAAHGA